MSQVHAVISCQPIAKQSPSIRQSVTNCNPQSWKNCKKIVCFSLEVADRHTTDQRLITDHSLSSRDSSRSPRQVLWKLILVGEWSATTWRLITAWLGVK